MVTIVFRGGWVGWGGGLLWENRGWLQCPGQIRAEVSACDLPTYRSHLGQQMHSSPTYLSFQYAIETARHNIRMCVFFARCIRILIWMYARSQTVQALEVVPWATDKPSFSAELARIVEYITRPEVG